MQPIEQHTRSFLIDTAKQYDNRMLLVNDALVATCILQGNLTPESVRHFFHNDAQKIANWVKCTCDLRDKMIAQNVDEASKKLYFEIAKARLIYLTKGTAMLASVVSRQMPQSNYDRLNEPITEQNLDDLYRLASKGIHKEKFPDDLDSRLDRHLYIISGRRVRPNSFKFLDRNCQKLVPFLCTGQKFFSYI
jgi:hypothetical protein